MPLKEEFAEYRTYILRFWAVVGGGLLVFAGYMFALSLSNDIPDVVELQNPRSFLATEIYAADGALLGSYYRENRSNAAYQELPQHLVDALIATEDVRFRNHAGVDLRALLRVVKGLLTFNTAQGGGSTLTQQLAKNLYPREAGLSTIGIINRKFKEWILAARLEKNFTKDEILVLYLNTVPFMYDAYGIKSCAKTYFAKDVKDLSIEEGAAIVGMLQNPSLYNPVRRPERTRERRNVVLAQMHNYDYLEKAQKDSLQQLPLDVSRFTRQDHNAGMATYFREQLRQWMKDWCAQNLKPDGEPYDIYKDGLRIYTTIDSRMQAYAEESMQTWMTKLQDDFFKHWNKDYKYEPWTYPYNDRKDPEFLNKKMRQSDRYRSARKQKMPEDSIELVFNTPIPMTVFSWHGNQNHELDTVMSPLDSIRYHRKILHMGLLALDPETGFIRAWVGGISHRHFKLDHVNKGTRRQVGSTFKPFIYTAALQAGYYPCQQVPNVPVTFQAGDPRFGLLRSWTPKNSSHDREGQMVTLYWALANSVNFISAFLMDKIGTQPIVDMAHKMGIEAEIPNQPSICLGTPEISLYEMVGAYTIFANQGGYTEPVFISRIEDKNGVILYENFGANSEEVMKPQDAYVMLNMLQNVMQYGTGQRIRRSPYGALPGAVQIAGKTGTTQQHTDGWFMGLLPNLVGGVWVGADDPVVAFRSISYGQGANMALPIYGNFLRQVLENGKLGVQASDRFPVPDRMEIELNCSAYQTPGSGDEGEDPYLELEQ